LERRWSWVFLSIKKVSLDDWILQGFWVITRYSLHNFNCFEIYVIFALLVALYAINLLRLLWLLINDIFTDLRTILGFNLYWEVLRIYHFLLFDIY
jgi:hypothetical protein